MGIKKFKSIKRAARRQPVAVVPAPRLTEMEILEEILRDAGLEALD
jgi:hypothetical protein